MKISDDFDRDEFKIKSSATITACISTVITILLIIVCIVFVVNNKKTDKISAENEQNVISSNAVGIMDIVPDNYSTITSDELDFWNMYKDKETSTHTNSNDLYNYDEKEEILEQLNEEEDFSENGTKTEVILPDGTSLWVMINAYIPKNEYDYTGLVYEEPIMRYYSNGKKISKTGIRVNHNSYPINFSNLAKNNIDYAIIRLGRRGYSTGFIEYDESFSDYMTDIIAAEVPYGISFYSQAITEEEAVEEANFVINTLKEDELQPKYPIYLDLEQIQQDVARTDDLTRTQLTNITKAFCETITASGYQVIISGDKYWLLRKLDLTQLKQFYVDLEQELDIPDYPYQYAVWEYKQQVDIDDVGKECSLQVSFIDFELK